LCVNIKHDVGDIQPDEDHWKGPKHVVVAILVHQQ